MRRGSGLRISLLLFLLGCRAPGEDPFANFCLLLPRQHLVNLTALHTLAALEHSPFLVRLSLVAFSHGVQARLEILMDLVNSFLLAICEVQAGKIVHRASFFRHSRRSYGFGRSRNRSRRSALCSSPYCHRTYK